MKKTKCFNINFDKNETIKNIDEIKDNVLILDDRIVVTKNAALYQNFNVYNKSKIKKFYLENEKLLMDFISYSIFNDRELEFPKEEYSFKEILSTVKESESIISFLNDIKYNFNNRFQKYILKYNDTYIVILLDATHMSDYTPNCIMSIKDVKHPIKYKTFKPYSENKKYLLPFINYKLLIDENNYFISKNNFKIGSQSKSDYIEIENTYENNLLDFGEEDEYSGEDLDEMEVFKDVITVPANTKDCILMKFFSGVYFYKYTVKDKEEDKFLSTYLNDNSIPSMLECLWVAMQYKKENKPMYKHYSINTTSKVREIYAPENDVKKALKNLLAPLNKNFETKNDKNVSNQSAFIRNQSIKNNAKIHADNKYIVKCDIKGFYDSCNWVVTKPHLNYYLNSIKIDDENKNLENIALIKNMIINPKTNGLYMGSPLSGVLSNLIIRSAALHLKNIFEAKHMKFSIYADDITVSSDEPIKPSYITGTIKYVFESHKLPFKLKPEKTKLGKNNGRRITGIRINHLDQLTIDRKKYYMLKVYLHRLSKGLDIDIPISKLQGYLSFAKFIDESGKIDRLLEKYDNIISNNNINVNIDAIDDATASKLFEDPFE